MAIKITKSEFVGVGALFQFAGLILMVVSWVFGLIVGCSGTFGGLVLLIYGSSQATIYLCGDCKNKITKDCAMCPTCKSRF